MTEHTHVKQSRFTPWKAGDRILVEAIVESVFDGVSNWPVKIVLDAGDSETIDRSRNVHYSAIHPIENANDALIAALKDWLAFAEEELGEFDLEVCDVIGPEGLCPKCESSGCINRKIRNTRAALAKASA